MPQGRKQPTGVSPLGAALGAFGGELRTLLEYKLREKAQEDTQREAQATQGRLFAQQTQLESGRESAQAAREAAAQASQSARDEAEDARLREQFLLTNLPAGEVPSDARPGVERILAGPHGDIYRSFFNRDTANQVVLPEQGHGRVFDPFGQQPGAPMQTGAPTPVPQHDALRFRGIAPPSVVNTQSRLEAQAIKDHFSQQLAAEDAKYKRALMQAQALLAAGRAGQLGPQSEALMMHAQAAVTQAQAARDRIQMGYDLANQATDTQQSIAAMSQWNQNWRATLLPDAGSGDLLMLLASGADPETIAAAIAAKTKKTGPVANPMGAAPPPLPTGRAQPGGGAAPTAPPPSFGDLIRKALADAAKAAIPGGGGR